MVNTHWILSNAIVTFATVSFAAPSAPAGNHAVGQPCNWYDVNAYCDGDKTRVYCKRVFGQNPVYASELCSTVTIKEGPTVEARCQEYRQEKPYVPVSQGGGPGDYRQRNARCVPVNPGYPTPAETCDPVKTAVRCNADKTAAWTCNKSVDQKQNLWLWGNTCPLQCNDADKPDGFGRRNDGCW